MKTRIKFKEKYSIENCIGFSSKDTHLLNPYKKLYNYAMRKWVIENDIATPIVLDPFSRRCLWGTHRNDINPLFFQENMTTHCLDALEFMTEIETNSAHIVLFDPTFSERQSD